MKLKENIDIIAFLKSVKQCRSDVYFNSAQGDHLNLKSELCQYVLSASICSGHLIHEGVIVCEDRGDYEMLDEYLLT